MKTAAKPRRFFADENFQLPLVRLLRAYLYNQPHITIHALEETEGFCKGMADEEWLERIGQWIPRPTALCGDGRILERPAQLSALKDAKVHFVHLAQGWTSFAWEVSALKWLTAWQDVYKNTGKEREPTIFRVTTNSKVDTIRKIADHQCHSEKKRTQKPGRNQSA